MSIQDVSQGPEFAADPIEALPRRTHFQRAVGWVRSLFQRFGAEGDQAWLLLLALLVGAIMGCVSALFRYLIHASHQIFFKAGEGMDGRPEQWIVVLFPALGGLIVGFFIYRVLKLTGGHGVPSVMKAVATGNTQLSPVMAIKSSSSIITMTSGGSAGPEGPIVEIGSVVGSQVGRHGQVPKDRVATLIGCGAASGVAAVFNAPIGGVFLALELIMRDFAVRTFGPVVLAAVIASVTSQAILPNDPTFIGITASAVESIKPTLTQTAVFATLGILCGLLGGLLVLVIYRMHDLFSTINIPNWIKPGIGGLGVGLLGLAQPQVIGEGYAYVNEKILTPALEGGLSLSLSVSLAALFLGVALLKVFATALTLGSGGTGGSFAPAMVMGASAGAGFGVLCNLALPGQVPEISIFAMVGMAGCVCSSLNLPIAGILIVYEVSGAQYRMVLPLMLCVAVSALVSTGMRLGSVYTLSLLRDGFDVDEAVRRRNDPLAAIPVVKIMRQKFVRLKPDDNLAIVLSAFSDSLEDDFAVLDERGQLIGLIPTRDLRGVLNMGDLGEAIIAADAADTNPPVLYADSPVTEALAIFSSTDVSGIPVLANRHSRRMIGLVGRSDVLHAYHGKHTNSEG